MFKLFRKGTIPADLGDEEQVFTLTEEDGDAADDGDGSDDIDQSVLEAEHVGLVTPEQIAEHEREVAQ